MSNTNQATQPGSHAHVSLSAYFPRGTQYFYGYPAGEDSNFLNKVPPKTDELVAARALSCAGPEVSVVSFSSTTAPTIDTALQDALAIPKVTAEHLTLLPESINGSLLGKRRNEAIMAALAKSVAPGTLIMAQPFDGKAVERLYKIPPSLSIWMNDKANLPKLIKPSLLPARLAEYESGAAFAADSSLLEIPNLVPCVVKVSSSSSGDGVYICMSLGDVKQAQASIGTISGSVFVERFVTPVKNYAIHFGIPHDKNQPIDIIGVNEQLTSAEGEFFGGIIAGETIPPELAQVKTYLEEDALPRIRAYGWYGIGGFDVIIDTEGQPFLIDGNFRMTGMSAYHFLIANGKITKPMISFGGKFTGSPKAFEHAILPYAGKDSAHRTVQLIALSRHDDHWEFNGALMYDDMADLQQKIRQILTSNISSPALEMLLEQAR